MSKVACQRLSKVAVKRRTKYITSSTLIYTHVYTCIHNYTKLYTPRNTIHNTQTIHKLTPYTVQYTQHYPHTPHTLKDYNFASSTYVSAFGDLPTPSFDTLRSQALKYLQDDFKKESWSSDPVTTILAGVPLQSGSVSDTVDAFGGVNGKIRHASEQEIDRIIEHVNSYTPPVIDCRTAVRAIEDELLSVYPGLLIGNQAVDFLKQDGVTEIEESIQANVVERRMNDSLLSDEQAGLVVIDRSPAFVGCVSNFSNFLDLFRKVLRNVELGVPCVVLSRTNTTQHSYRWTALLVDLMAKHGVDAGMLTYASSDLEGVKRILGSSPPTCPSYFTCSRDLAMAVKSARPNTVCSTGGPNTLVAPSLTAGAREAIRFSAGIENSGQCTALRHAVVGGGATKEDVEGIFEGAPVVDSPEDSLERGEFSGVFPHSPMHPTPSGYTSVPSYPARYRISRDLPEDGLEEYWRNVFVDVTSTEGKVEAGTEEAEGLAKWLVRNQVREGGRGRGGCGWGELGGKGREEVRTTGNPPQR